MNVNTKKLTVLLILKDRVPFTLRWMDYANTIKFPFHIMAIDGGQDPAVKNIFSDKTRYPNISYEYIRYPYDASLPIFYKKLQDAVTNVSSSYVLQVDNDDFYLPGGILDSINFLEKHPEYICSQGPVYSFNITPTQESLLWGQINNIEKLYIGESNTQPSGLERFEFFSKRPESFWHNVYRTEYLRNFFDLLVDSHIEDIQLAEYLINGLTVASGKTHRGSELFMLHQAQPDSLGLTLAKQNPSEWILKESWPKEFTKLIEIISSSIALHDHTPEDQIRLKVTQYYLAYTLKIRFSSMSSKNRASLLDRYIVKNNPLRKLARIGYRFIKNYHRGTKNKKDIRSLPYFESIEMVNKFLQSGGK